MDVADSIIILQKFGNDVADRNYGFVDQGFCENKVTNNSSKF
jgi:hypothetical protein